MNKSNNNYKWVVVDVEADGPIPGKYSMINFGAVEVTAGLDNTFYGELKPISNEYCIDALKVSGFTREQTLGFPDPLFTMSSFIEWCRNIKADRLMFVSDNNGFDWQFMNYYFYVYCNENPFGHSSTNLGSLYKGLVRDVKKNFKHLRKTKHDHNPLNDAKGNAEVMLYLMSKIKGL